MVCGVYTPSVHIPDITANSIMQNYIVLSNLLIAGISSMYKFLRPLCSLSYFALRSTPGSLRLYCLLKDRMRGMAEKPHSRYSNWKASQPEVSSTYFYVRFKLPNCSFTSHWQFTFSLKVPGHIDLGMILARLGM